MKSFRKTVFASILFLAYGWVLLVGNSAFGETEKVQTNSPSDGQNYTSLSTDFFYPASQSQSSVTISFGSQPGSIGDTQKLNHTLLLATNELQVSLFRQNVSDSANRLIEHRKADKLFPHHYFW